MKYFKVFFLSLLMFVTPPCIFADDGGNHLAGFYRTSAEIDLSSLGLPNIEETWYFRFDPNGTVILTAETNDPAIGPIGELIVHSETPGLGVWKRTGKRTLKFALRYHIRDEVGLSSFNADLTVGGLYVATAMVDKMGNITSVDGQTAIIDENSDTSVGLPKLPTSFTGTRETVNSLESLMNSLP